MCVYIYVYMHMHAYIHIYKLVKICLNVGKYFVLANDTSTHAFSLIFEIHFPVVREKLFYRKKLFCRKFLYLPSTVSVGMSYHVK